MSFTIRQDTKEKIPWDFFFYKECDGIHVEHLKEGDYTTQELFILEKENVFKGIKTLRIERKASTGEIANNLGRLKKSFYKEMDRLSYYSHAYLVMEFTPDVLSEFPCGSGIPERFWYRKNAKGKRVKNIKMSGPYMLRLIDDIKDEYGINIVYANNREDAMDKVVEIINEAHKYYRI